MAQATNGGDGLFRQVVVLAVPGLGAGAQVDAPSYRDRGADTLAHVAAYVGGLELPTLTWLGLGNVARARGVEPAAPPAASVGRVTRASKGRDGAGALQEAVGAAVTALAGGVPVVAVGGAAEVFGHVAGVETRRVGPREVLAEAATAAMLRAPGALVIAAPEADQGLAGVGPVGVARALARLDASLSAMLDQLGDETLLILCGLGGNDATVATREGATRELGPLLVFSPAVPSGVDLGTRLTLADVGATAAEVFGAAAGGSGRSFLADLLG